MKHIAVDLCSSGGGGWCRLQCGESLSACDGSMTHDLIQLCGLPAEESQDLFYCFVKMVINS